MRIGGRQHGTLRRRIGEPIGYDVDQPASRHTIASHNVQGGASGDVTCLTTGDTKGAARRMHSLPLSIDGAAA